MRVEIRGEPAIVGKDPNTGDETSGWWQTIDVMPDQQKMLASGVSASPAPGLVSMPPPTAEMDGARSRVAALAADGQRACRRCARLSPTGRWL